MTTSNRPHSMPRVPWPLQFAALGVLAALVTYLLFFTPEQRAVRQRLAEADAKSQAAIGQRLQPLAALFAKGRKGAKGFAEEALSWEGKWELLKGLVDGGESHQRYLSEAFARHAFSADELREAMEGAVAGYLDDIEGVEAEMLVQLRADLADGERASEPLPADLRGNDQFRDEYRKLSGRVATELHLELGVTVGREVGIMIASDVAAQVALQAAKSAATEMGVNTGVLGTGAASTVATLGVGMVIALILDYVLDEVFKMAGYDPAAQIEALVIETIDRLETSLIGDPGPFSVGKKGALRERLEQLHVARSALRRETIHRFVKEGGMR